MSSIKHRLLTGGLVAGASILAAGAVSSPALAAGTAITGIGASLQGAAQAAWLDPSVATSWGRATNHISGGTGTYTPGSSSLALNAFGNNSGTLGAGLPSFGGSDDPPTTAQLSSAQAASGTPEVAVPVLQAPVAIEVSVPNRIVIGGVSGAIRLQVTNALLEQVFENATPVSWRTFLTAALPSGATLSDGGSGQLATQLERQTRASGSGTTFSLKGYLNAIASPSAPFTRDGSTTWPNAGTNLTTTNCTVANAGGGELSRAVAGDTDGSIGYANLADAVAAGFTSTLGGTAASNGPCGARSTQIAYALVQNNGTSGSPAFADPIVTSARGVQRANTNPSGSWGGTLPARYTDTWVNAQPWNISAGSTFYGLIAGSYVLAWDNYSASNLVTAYGGATPAADQGQTVRNYVQYLINNNASGSPSGERFATDGGQTLLAATSTSARFYSALPASVRTLAETAANNVN